MSEKMTRVKISGVPGFMVRGHVSRDEAIADAERHYQHELEVAEQALDAIRHGRLQVLHQRGIYRPRNVHVVNPDIPEGRL